MSRSHGPREGGVGGLAFVSGSREGKVGGRCRGNEADAGGLGLVSPEGIEAERG